MRPFREKGQLPPVLCLAFGFPAGSGGVRRCLLEGRARPAYIFALGSQLPWLIGRLIPRATPSPKWDALLFFFFNSSVAAKEAWLDCGVVGFRWLVENVCSSRVAGAMLERVLDC